MHKQEKNLIDAALRQGAHSAACIAVAGIHFRPEFRKACEANSCGKYGACWMCPPDVGPVDVLIADAKTRTQSLVFQTVGLLEDSFDIEGMEAAAVKHNAVLASLYAAVLPGLARPLVLGAGACHVCKPCTRVGGTACAHPDKALPSLEAYGIAVSELAKSCGLPYTNGQNTVTYFGAILFDNTIPLATSRTNEGAANA